MANSYRLAITGASGRMGRAILEAYATNPGVAQLVTVLDHPTSEWIGRDAGALVGQQMGVSITSDVSSLASAQVVIDFTRPEATMEYLSVAQASNVAMVIGTTGFNNEQKVLLKAAAQTRAVLQSTNMGWGVNATFDILAYAAKVLGSQYDVEIVEMHHKHKVDAPSGTGLTMGERIADAWGTNLEECAVYGRQGITGERKTGTIGFSAVRGGDIIGEHTVIFAGAGERIEITHRATNRSMWANGALKAAAFLQAQPAGWYEMKDVIDASLII
ncbi:MAG: 4-hydroxy-tetrahydrodipicolinate reductase [Pseudomonadota bacterium]